MGLQVWLITSKQTEPDLKLICTKTLKNSHVIPIKQVNVKYYQNGK